MYFNVKGYYQFEDGQRDEIDWILSADNKEEALKQITEAEIITEISEISIGECIEREKMDLLENIKWEYVYRRASGKTVREFNKIARELSSSSDIMYLAIKEFNAKQRLTKRLSRQEGFKDMTMAEFNKKINQLIDAKNEEEFNRILRIIQK